MVTEIEKRDGRKEPYVKAKVTGAIFEAAKQIGGSNYLEAEDLADQVTWLLNQKFTESTPTVEDVQDTVEKALIDNGHVKTAKAFILYRAERTQKRDMSSNLMKTMHKLTFGYSKDIDMKRENANIDTDTPMGTMLKYGTEASKQYNHLYLLDKDASEAHLGGDIHIHDLDFYGLTMTCVQIPLDKVFKGGFNTGHGFLREPNSIRSYSALACIVLQSSQNDMHGGQSIPYLDHYLAPGVAKTFVNEIAEITATIEDVDDDVVKAIKTALRVYLKSHNDRIINTEGKEFIKKTIRLFVSDVSTNSLKRIWKRALKRTDKETYQAMEALLHNFNTMHSRAGSQVPFSSVNYGMDTSEEGRLIMRNILLATESGMGNGETCIFPIQVFQVKEGVNYNSCDPNYDLFKLSMRVSAKRLFPNYVFVDAPHNIQYYKEGQIETVIATMGCRTRVFGNTYDKDREVITGRGNLSFTSINLPRLAIESEGDLTKFYELLNNELDLVTRQLLKRFELQCTKKVRNFPFLMGSGVWIDSEKLGKDDEVREIIKHGSLSYGFIGLAETLISLTGKHHGESADSQELGLNIIRYMRAYADRMAEETGLNFSLLATPAESLSGRFVKIDKQKYGVIKGVTDKDYYTNSFHVPVYHKINAYEKIELEAPYHELTNAGHISYIEVDGDIANNVDAFESIIKCMKESGIGYGSINHPVDRDPVCGYTGVIDGDVCPNCGRHEDEGKVPFDRIRRITGYLVGTLDKWGNSKQAEERERVKHSIGQEMESFEE